MWAATPPRNATLANALLRRGADPPSQRERIVSEYSVVGLDLDLGRSVHLLDQPRSVWKRKGYGGDGTLVCWHCYHGVDAPPGTRVPLVFKGGKKYGKVRAHFAHPANQAPPGGHHPETVWHANAKQMLVRWATGQAVVVDARTEYWTADGRRRSDVQVRLTDGTELIFEVQQQPLTDETWIRRHDDYVAAGLVDVWFWHAALGVPGIARDEPQCHWLLAADLQQIGAPLATAHRLDQHWWEQPAQRLYGLHHPPCPGDEVITRWAAADQFTIDPTGLVLPSSVCRELREQAAQAAQRARQVRERIAAGGLPPPWTAPARTPRAHSPGPVVSTDAGHQVQRYDALPPDADPALRRYFCRICDSVTSDVLTDGVHKLIEYP
jgi:hypothetical protein